MKNFYDVAIVGAGPAGSFLAYLLSKEKFKVILIDKEKFPREKICAGGLTPKVLKIIPFNLKPVIEKEIFSLRLISKSKKNLYKKYQRPFVYTVKRARFDNFLAQKAKRVGAVFLPKHKVKKIVEKNGFWQIEAGNKLVKAKVVVGADGANSFVARLMGFRVDSIDIGLQYEIPHLKQQNTQTITIGWDLIPDGYAWVFPNRQFLEVGVAGPKSLGKKLKLYLETWVKFLGLKRDNLPLSGYPIVHRLRQTPLVKDKMILIGEAAGLNEPLTGEGIFYALKSAQIAAKHLKDFLTGNPTALKNYERNINQEILPELKTAYLLKKISPIFSPFVFKLIKKNDYYWDVLYRLFSGGKTFLEVKKQLRPDRFIKRIYEIKRATSKFSKSQRYT